MKLGGNTNMYGAEFEDDSGGFENDDDDYEIV